MVELAPPAVMTTAEDRLLGPEGCVPDFGASCETHLPELPVELLSDPVGPFPVVWNRRDDEESGPLRPQDGIDDGLMPVQQLLFDNLQSHDAGVPDIIRPATENVVAGERRLLNFLAEPLDPVPEEPPSSLDEIHVGAEPIALRLVRNVFHDELVLGGQMVVDGHVTVAHPVLLNQSVVDGHLKGKRTIFRIGFETMRMQRIVSIVSFPH